MAYENWRGFVIRFLVRAWVGGGVGGLGVGAAGCVLAGAQIFARLFRATRSNQCYFERERRKLAASADCQPKETMQKRRLPATSSREKATDSRPCGTIPTPRATSRERAINHLECVRKSVWDKSPPRLGLEKFLAGGSGKSFCEKSSS